MTLTLSFKLGSFKNVGEVFDFAINHLHFTPIAIMSAKAFKKGYQDFDIKQAREKITTSNDFFFQIADDFNKYFDEKNKFMYRVDERKCLEYFIIDFEVIKQDFLTSLMVDANKKGLFMAFLDDPIKSLWQSEIFPQNYFAEKRPFHHLNLKYHWHPLHSPIVKAEVIDIFQNPGHKIMTYNTWLMAAPEMWFGRDSWRYFNKEKIKLFKAAVKLLELSDDLLYIGKSTQIDPPRPNETDPPSPFQIDPLIPAQIDPLKSEIKEQLFL